MSRRNQGHGLMTAGLIVVAAGLLFIAIRELQIPRYWIPVIVGAALFVAGMLRWLMSDRDSSPHSGSPPSVK